MFAHCWVCGHLEAVTVLAGEKFARFAAHYEVVPGQELTVCPASELRVPVSTRLIENRPEEGVA